MQLLTDRERKVRHPLRLPWLGCLWRIPDISHLVVARDNGYCAFADGTPSKLPLLIFHTRLTKWRTYTLIAIPNGQRGCGPRGGVTGNDLTNAIFECNNGNASQVDKCPFKRVSRVGLLQRIRYLTGPLHGISDLFVY
jgi:hypothetical protein